MKTLNIIILLAVASSLTGCASTMLSTDKIAINILKTKTGGIKFSESENISSFFYLFEINRSYLFNRLFKK